MPAIDSTIQLRKPPPSGCDDILSAGALDFLAALAHRFEPRRRELLERRRVRQAELDAGRLPDFLPDTRSIREDAWTVAPIPADLRDRRVEITGPVDRKMMINALNSGANVFMADFEDANAPTWENNVVGQRNLKDAVAGTISYVSPEGKRYALAAKTATLFVRPRGWHLVEQHVHLDGAPISASLFDFGLAFYHNTAALIAKGSGPYFYLPKMESHLEARLWNDVFTFAQDALRIPRGTIRATVLIETILAAFETDEILWELRDHSAGLNCGRWDYIFSYIKKLRRDPERILPDRARVTMEQPFLKSYAELVIRTNLDVAVRYLAAWLGALGCVPINDLMEDAATAEISRAQVWQWQRHGARLQDGRYVNAALIQQTLSEVMASLPERVGAEAAGAGQFSLAARILADLTTGAEFAEFLTTVAYDYLD